MRLSLVLCLSCAALCALAEESTLTPAASSSISDPSTNTTTSAPSTTSTTVAPSNSTTPAPSTSTTTAPSNSTTPAPSTSTTPAPIPVPVVLPLPAAKEYDVRGDGNKTCMIAKFAAQFNIPYNQTNKQSVTGYLNVENGEVDPSTKCDWNATSIDLKINFDNNDNMVLSFKDDGTKRWVHQLVLTYTPSNSTIFPGHPAPTVPKTETFTNLTLFIATGEKAYYCIAGEQAVSDTDSVTAKFGNVIVDAFRPQTAPVDYRERQDCANTDVSDLVPIAVGIALLSLVVIVLIAYFIGRRRSRRLAYQSV